MFICEECEHKDCCVYKSDDPTFCFPQMSFNLFGVFAPAGHEQACKIIDEKHSKRRDRT